MKAVVVQVDAVINADSFEINAIALKDAGAMVRTGRKKDLPNHKIPATMKNQEMWTLKITLGGILPGPGHVSFAGEKLRPVSIDGPRTFDRDVVGVRSSNHHDVAVARRDAVTWLVVLDVGTAKEPAVGSKMQCHIAFQLERTDNEVTRRNQHGPTLVSVAQVNCCLDRRGIERTTVAFRAKVANVADARTGRFVVSDETGGLLRGGITPNKET